jgi:large subunit ribosomal protein L31e
MAEDEEIERIFTIPLRSTKKVPKPKRANHAIKSIKKYIAKHMKGDISAIWIDETVNHKIWERSREHPPSSIRVKAQKFPEDEIIEVTIPEE